MLPTSNLITKIVNINILWIPLLQNWKHSCETFFFVCFFSSLFCYLLRYKNWWVLKADGKLDKFPLLLMYLEGRAILGFLPLREKYKYNFVERNETRASLIDKNILFHKTFPRGWVSKRKIVISPFPHKLFYTQKLNNIYFFISIR